MCELYVNSRRSYREEFADTVIDIYCIDAKLRVLLATKATSISGGQRFRKVVLPIIGIARMSPIRHDNYPQSLQLKCDAFLRLPSRAVNHST